MWEHLNSYAKKIETEFLHNDVKDSLPVCWLQEWQNQLGLEVN